MAKSGAPDLKQADPRPPEARRAPARRRAAPDVDFWAAFEAAPDAYLLLAPDAPRFTMVAANAARLRVTKTRREEVLGRGLFDVFPDNPGDPAATGVRNLRASLEAVIRKGEPHRMALQQYDIRSSDGTFEGATGSPSTLPSSTTAGR